ncbi:MAG TPA: MFS transporter [Cyclobacteriaceae bacterium]|jgi:predicted MFS family arabinose efflux permease|nr:MFS transporter [Cyclobacteriaceae bacterium]HRE65508.1 MFS transporter [Cyclobacteriaceae bacterium]HRF32574.1 MFS transporter [Cyclobacteriaceae bacterium]
MKPKKFSGYEVFVIAILTILQFSIILDFMVLSPLGPILRPALNVSTAQFGIVVAAYAISAGLSGLLAAGFADKYDRKKLLLFFYTGFILGTLFCGLAPTYPLLLAARIFTGVFGGVIGSITFAIVTDLFLIEVRGRVMGFLQMAFASSQILGLPIGLYFANKWGWHSPFIMIVLVSIGVAIAILIYLKPIDEHLKVKTERNAFRHLIKTISTPMYIKTFAATTLLATGGFMMMPFGADFGVNNLKISLDQLPMLYMITGIASMILGPLLGRASDSWGKYRMFVAGSILMIFVVIIYCNLGPTPIWVVVILNIVMFAGISARMISSQALVSAVPDQTDRGAFMSLNAATQQISGGIASYIAGMIVVQASTGELLHYDTLGYVVAVSIIITIGLIWFVNQYVATKLHNTRV